MKKRILSMLLSLAVLVSMCIPCTAFAESEGATNISITVCEPVVGQPYHEGYTIDGIDYSMSLKTSAMSETLGHFNYMRKYEGGWGAMSEGALFDYDSTYTIEVCIMCPSMDKPFTGSYTATVNGRSAKVVVQPDQLSMSITCEFKTGSRESIEDIYLDGYKPVKVGTTPARISKSEADTEGNYTATGYYTDFYMAQANEIYSFKAGKDYSMRIYVEAPYSYTFNSIKPENIHIEGYNMPDEGVEIRPYDGSLGGSSSTLVITLPAVTAEENIYEFTVPEPKEGELPGNVTLQANDDIICTGTTWYKSPCDWFESPDTVKMKEGEKFEAGYDYFVQPQYSWKDEELAQGSYTIKVNGDTCNGNYYCLGHLYRSVDMKITVAAPKLGGTPAQTFSANIPISDQECRWYFLPNAPSTDGFQPMEPTDKFALGCCYAFVPNFKCDRLIYTFNRIYVNGVDISEKDFMMFGPLAKCEDSETPVHTHSYTNYVVTDAATLTADGILKAACDIAGCDAEDIQCIPRISSVKSSTSTYTYNGKVKSPSLTVKDAAGNVLAKGTDYTYTTPSGRKNVGTYTYDVTFKGNYCGSETVSFVINPAKPSIKPVLAGKKKLTVKMKTKVASTGGATYQIAYKQKGTSKWKYTTTTKQSEVIKKLKKGKRYYVKVRAYKTVSKVKYYGAWSETKLSKKIK